MKRKLYIFMVLILLSCEDKVVLEFDRLDRRLVVSGGITNLEGPYYVFLTYPAVYSYTPDPAGEFSRRAINAEVSVVDDLGNEYMFEESENTPALYVSNPDELQGEIGRSYFVRITTTEGITFESIPEELVEVTEIDSVYSELENGTYNIYIDMHDNPGFGDYYQWQFLFNGNLNSGLDYETDEYFDGGSLKGLRLGRVSVDQLDNPAEVTVQQLSISKRRYDFLYLFDQQISNGGNPFDSPAAPIVGNVLDVDDPNNYALGYFYASAVSRKTLILP